MFLAQFELKLIDEKLNLVRDDGIKIFVDFLEGATAYRIRTSFSEPEILIKALGGAPDMTTKTLPPQTLIDATAGLGEDALLAAFHGFQVLAFEKNSMIFALLNDALRRFQENTGKTILPRDKVAATDLRFKIEHQDFLKVKPHPVGVIYLDPMFPEKKKSSLPRKEIQILKELLSKDSIGGEVGIGGRETDLDLTAAMLLEHARKFSGSRVVLKRPLRAPLVAPDIQGQVHGKLVRFDIYRAP